MVLFLEVGVDDGEVVKEDGHQVGAIETPVLLMRDILFDKRHAVEIAQEVGAPDVGGRDTLVAQFAEKASVAAVDGIGDTAEVTDVVVSRASVDVVDGHTGWDLFIAPCYIDGMGSKDSFHATESMPEVQIPLFALGIVNILAILASCRKCIHQYFSSIGIDTYADYPALSVVDIERDTGFRAGADVGDPHVVKEEGRADQIRLADDFKAAFSQAILIRNFIHKHRQSGESLSRLAMQK